MNIACEHTRLMNKFMGLCDPSPGWPSVLHDCGYRVQAIEQKLRINDTTSVKPDIIVASGRERHALVIECKSGMNVKPEQEKRYAKLDTGTVRKWAKARPPPESHTVSYAINSHARERIATHTRLPLAVFYKSRLESRGSFGADRLDRAMRDPINFDTMVEEPTEYYPYGPDDDDSVIAQHVLQALTQLLRGNSAPENLSSDATVDKVFKINHTYHKMISEETSNRIKKKIKDLIEFQLIPDKSVMRLLRQIQKGEHNTHAWPRLLDASAGNVRKNSAQKRL